MKSIIKKTRDATVEISSQMGNSKGTGFFIGKKHVATCFHVIASIEVVAQNQVNWTVFPDIRVKTNFGEILNAKLVSIPSSKEMSPLQNDFAVLELSTAPIKVMSILSLALPKNQIEVGDDVVFSGYPLATPAMVTHTGIISGMGANSEIICIQAPINKGNSGGALCNEKGDVIGIVSMREGGISVGLQQLNQHIDKTSKQGATVAIMGIDPLQAIREINDTLNQYISTGIGYARSVSFLRTFTEKNSKALE